MDRKIIGIFVCILIIAVPVLSVTGIKVYNNEECNDVRMLTQQINNAGINSMADWSEFQKFIAPDYEGFDSFGVSVSIDGNLALIGAYWDDDSGNKSGSAYVLYHCCAWILEAKLLASDGAAYDEFGYSVSISGDYAIIGAAYDDNINGVDAGAAYIFKRSGTNWTQEVKLTASDGEDSDLFGISVSLNADYAIVGAYEDDNINGVDAGAAYVFKRSGISWTQEIKLTASDGEEGDKFGCSVSLNGHYAIAGAFLATNDGNQGDAGSAYIFKRTDTRWMQEAKLLASDGAANDHFGTSVSISGDTALVGAVWDDNSNGVDAGAAYVFKRSTTNWQEEAKLTASDGAYADYFGIVFVIGDYAIIGATYHDNDNRVDAGAAYIFKRSTTNWQEEAKLTASDGQPAAHFGNSVSLSGDYALIGAYGDDIDNYDVGSSYIFKKNDENQSPTTPFLDGPMGGKVGKNYTYRFVSIDPDNDQLYYLIDWGDQTNSSWLGPYISGEEVLVSHKWSKRGTYIIKAKAKDTFGSESDWGELEVSMPRIISFKSMFIKFLERPPYAFPILRYLMGL
jgi:hypothetical protein